jgi:hypothetical protein
MRPKTLAEVAELTLQGNGFHLCLRNFLDDFYLQPTSAALEPQPKLLATIVERGDVSDAYLAATAEELACKFGFDTPSWSYAPSRQLHRPWFAVTLSSMRALLLVESPAAFRSRNLFVSDNALSRV